MGETSVPAPRKPPDSSQERGASSFGLLAICIILGVVVVLQILLFRRMQWL